MEAIKTFLVSSYRLFTSQECMDIASLVLGEINVVDKTNNESVSTVLL